MLPDFDEDYIPLALIAVLAVIWITGVWKGGDVVALAADVVNFGIGAIAGYMSRDRRA